MNDITRKTQEDARSGLVAAGRAIEEESFRIIDAEMGDHPFSPAEWTVVRRVIHTTGDFDYAERMRFHPAAIDSAVRALKNGAPVFSDTRMIGVGLSPWRLGWFNTRVITPATDPESHRWAEEMGTTRSVAAFRRCAPQMEGGIIAIGNAPTALLETIRLVEENGLRPAMVLGVPVGFVQAEESKQLLWMLESHPSITVLGRKGGSTVAVAIVHALLELAKKS